jgi:hypothetical protein
MLGVAGALVRALRVGAWGVAVPAALPLALALPAPLLALPQLLALVLGEEEGLPWPGLALPVSAGEVEALALTESTVGVEVALGHLEAAGEALPEGLVLELGVMEGEEEGLAEGREEREALGEPVPPPSCPPLLLGQPLEVLLTLGERVLLEHLLAEALPLGERVPLEHLLAEALPLEERELLRQPLAEALPLEERELLRQPLAEALPLEERELLRQPLLLRLTKALRVALPGREPVALLVLAPEVEGKEETERQAVLLALPRLLPL